MTDRELLELAAKAEGRTIKWMTQIGSGNRPDETFSACWNPLLDDGDALRLAVQLDMQFEYLEFTGYARARSRKLDHGEPRPWLSEYCMNDANEKDPLAATRRAIVRAAAELAKQEKS